MLRVRGVARPFFGVVQAMFRLPPILVLQVPEHVSEFPSSLIKHFFCLNWPDWFLLLVTRSYLANTPIHNVYSFVVLELT